MRILISKKDHDTLLIESSKITFEYFAGHNRVYIETNKGQIYIILLDHKLERVQISLLQNGYFDFREYHTDLKYYKG